jgi:hypothetical protein
MHRITCLTPTNLIGKFLHLDSLSSHAKQDHDQNANGYRKTRRFLDSLPYTCDPPKEGSRRRKGGKDWLGHIGPFHFILDSKGKEVSFREHVNTCLAGGKDKYGRRRKYVAYRGILNPPTEIQAALRDLCLRVPFKAESAFQDLLIFLARHLHKEFPNVSVQVAFHTRPGRAHWEWTIPKYREGKVVRKGVRWDGVLTTVRHTKHLLRAGDRGPDQPKLNSEIELNFCTRVVAVYRRALHKAGLAPAKKAAALEADIFFLRLQRRSLIDGMLARNRPRSLKAKGELKRNLERLREAKRKLRLERSVTSGTATLAASAQTEKERAKEVQEAKADLQPGRKKKTR